MVLNTEELLNIWALISVVSPLQGPVSWNANLSTLHRRSRKSGFERLCLQVHSDLWFSHPISTEWDVKIYSHLLSNKYLLILLILINPQHLIYACTHFIIESFLHHQSVSLQVEQTVGVDCDRQRHVTARGDFDQLNVGSVVLRDCDGTRRNGANWEDREWNGFIERSSHQTCTKHQKIDFNLSPRLLSSTGII